MMTRPWAEIHRMYAGTGGEAAHAMLNLVSAIEASPYVEGLFAWTSHLALCIAQTPVEYPYYGPYICISPLHSGMLEFRYIDTYIEEKQWRREASPAESFARLESFFDQLRWFIQPPSSAPSRDR